MKRKSIADVLHAVDPDLKVISGGLRKKKGTNWEMAEGNECPRCHVKALRFRPEDGVCINCAQFLNEKELQDARKKAKVLKYVKAHNARIDGHDKKKRRPNR